MQWVLVSSCLKKYVFKVIFIIEFCCILLYLLYSLNVFNVRISICYLEHATIHDRNNAFFKTVWYRDIGARDVRTFDSVKVSNSDLRQLGYRKV